MDESRDRLQHLLMDYSGYTGEEVVLVFDGYKRKGNPGEKTREGNIQVVYTPEGETADGYIEALIHEVGNNYNLRVATSDGLIQLSSLRSGVLRMPASELRQEVEAAREEMKKHYST